MRWRTVGKRLAIGLLVAVALNFTSWLLLADSRALTHRVAAQCLGPIGCDYAIVFGDLSASGVVDELNAGRTPNRIPQILSRVDFADLQFGEVDELGIRLEQIAGRAELRVVHLSVVVDDRIPCVATVTDELYGRGNFGAGWNHCYVWCGWKWVRVWSSPLWLS
jgi:hypothetical protein